jgi:hypothetical protein
MKVAIAMTRLKPLNHSIGAFEKKIFEQWLLLATMYLTEEDQIRVFNDDGNAEYHTVSPLDLIE